MADARTGQTPEGRMIEQAAKGDGRSIRKLAANAGISDTHWRHIVKGWQPGRNGQAIPVRALAMKLARMALVLDLTANDLREAGREDAAKILDNFANASPGDTVTLVDGDHALNFYVNNDGKPVLAGTADVSPSLTSRRDEWVHGVMGGLATTGMDEIDLIYASATMSPREKLHRIRQVLELRAQAEAEEGKQQKAAPASDAETATNGEPENQPS